jgi:predicted restriction endonuclease
MQKYIKIYGKATGWNELCEVCLSENKQVKAAEPHHINGRGKDIIENLMAICRPHHNIVNTNSLPKEKLKEIHSKFMLTV